MTSQLQVIYEDNHLLAINKQAGIATMGVAEDKPSVLREVKPYLKAKYHKPGNVYVGIISRLDAPVTGLLLLARTSKAAARLTEQFRERRVNKYYWALVEGKIKAADGQLDDWVRKDERHRKMHIASPKSAGAQEARLTYRTRQIGNDWSWLEIELHTGRKHQIRVQLAHCGYPVLGDRKYGSRRKFPHGIALHSRRLKFVHPVRKEPIVLEAKLPKSWSAFSLNL